MCVVFLDAQDSVARPPGEIREVFLSFKNAISPNVYAGFVNDLGNIMNKKETFCFAEGESQESEVVRKAQRKGREKEPTGSMFLLALCVSLFCLSLAKKFSLLHFSCFAALE